MAMTNGQAVFATGGDTVESKAAADALTALGITATVAELNTMDGVTASASEINILDGATLSTAELNYVDGVTSAIQTQLDAKQATLVSGTNIKTINSTSLLGSGDIVITGGGDLELDGTPASDDTYEGITITGFNADVNLTQWDAVFLNSTSEWAQADANGSGTYPARGLAVATTGIGDPVDVLIQGVVRNDAWNWTIGGTIYLSTTIAGLTQTPPSGSGEIVQAVGYALSADVAYFDFNSTYLTLA